MSDTGTILIEKLDIYAYHGVFAEEERLGQRFTLDLHLSTDLRASAISDAITDTVDYGRVIATVTQAFTARRFNLLEAAARAVATAVFGGFPGVSRIAITLRKPSPPIPGTMEAVGVRLDFSRED